VSRLNASPANSEDSAFPGLVTHTSTACTIASDPLSAVTVRGWVTVSTGSSTATLGSDCEVAKATFVCVSSSAMTA
jgi:hypothetical protein